VPAAPYLPLYLTGHTGPCLPCLLPSPHLPLQPPCLPPPGSFLSLAPHLPLVWFHLIGAWRGIAVRGSPAVGYSHHTTFGSQDRFSMWRAAQRTSTALAPFYCHPCLTPLSARGRPAPTTLLFCRMTSCSPPPPTGQNTGSYKTGRGRLGVSLKAAPRAGCTRSR